MNDRLQRLISSFENISDTALVDAGGALSYGALYSRIRENQTLLNEKGLPNNCVVGLQSDFSIDAIALFLSLLERGNIVALLSPQLEEISGFVEDAQIEYLLNPSAPAEWQAFTRLDTQHPLLQGLLDDEASGFVIFSSGTTGRPKAVLHGVENFMQSFDNAKKKLTTLTFLLFDHIAGIDTVFYTLSSKGCLVLPHDRSPGEVCRLIQDNKVEVLPASPSFLRLMYISGDYEQYDLSSLKIVTFGSEPMNESGLRNMQVMFPHAKSVQKYGTSEFGSPRSKSRSDNGLWIKLDSDNCQTKIVDETLWIKSTGSMLGYLNAPQPEVVDGWYNTGDKVEVDGEWIRILGRESDIINVGGEKVYPNEIENLINELDEVSDVLVYGEENAIMGAMVCARIQLTDPEMDNDARKALKKTVRKHCAEKLERYKVPSKFEFTTEALTNARQKKVRA
jgi:acyl-CoA synthetase (AMP-forming)/AMP-acid ligase II